MRSNDSPSFEDNDDFRDDFNEINFSSDENSDLSFFSFELIDNEENEDEIVGDIHVNENENDDNEFIDEFREDSFNENEFLEYNFHYLEFPQRIFPFLISMFFLFSDTNEYDHISCFTILHFYAIINFENEVFAIRLI